MQKIKAYTLNDIKRVLNEKGLTGIEKILVNGLRNQ